jgi:hypothetical protein
MQTHRRLILIVTQFMSFAAGWIACGFVEVLQVASPIMPLTCMGMLALNAWCMITFVEADREEVIKTQRRLSRARSN